MFESERFKIIMHKISPLTQYWCRSNKRNISQDS